MPLHHSCSEFETRIVQLRDSGEASLSLSVASRSYRKVRRCCRGRESVETRVYPETSRIRWYSRQRNCPTVCYQRQLSSSLTRFRSFRSCSTPARIAFAPSRISLSHLLLGWSCRRTRPTALPW